jgi:hypothetical protein
MMRVLAIIGGNEMRAATRAKASPEIVVAPLEVWVLPA